MEAKFWRAGIDSPHDIAYFESKILNISLKHIDIYTIKIFNTVSDHSLTAKNIFLYEN